MRISFFICVYSFLNFPLAHAADDLDWGASLDAVYEAGPGTPVVGKRWTLASVRDDVVFSIQLDTQTDMMRGNWHGDIRAPEKFFVAVYISDEAGNISVLKLDEARAVGPDAEYGAWKKSPATADSQIMQFDFTREKLMSLKNAKQLALKFTPYDAPGKMRFIDFSMDNFAARVSDLDHSIKSEGGMAYLMTSDEIQSIPIKDLPLAIRNPTQKDMTKVAKDLSVPVSDLMSLTITQVKTKIENKKTADREAARAAKRASHQAIYDQEPDWIDLNVCPKPDVKYCRNVGLEAYENSILLGGDFSYGKIKGVVWRSEGSIIRIYGGSINLGIEPEIYRTKSAGYYYIVKNDKGHLDIRPSDGMLVR